MKKPVEQRTYKKSVGTLSRAEKKARCKQRNLARRACKRYEAEERNAVTLPENRRQYRRVNKLGEFAK